MFQAAILWSSGVKTAEFAGLFGTAAFRFAQGKKPRPPGSHLSDDF